MHYEFAVASLSFHCVDEPSHFLALFPHRGDYLYAEHPAPGDRPKWRTESRHLLSDRLLQQGRLLYGVRFGPKTRYVMLDIDAGSTLHPARDLLALPRLLAALEPLGLVRHIAVRSSTSGGIHLYFPLGCAVESWAIASAVGALLQQAGCVLAGGQLECFPNPRGVAGAVPNSLYVGHRLPLQAGSYLLDRDWQPIYGGPAQFVVQWQQAEAGNQLDRRLVRRLMRQTQPLGRVRGRAAKLLQDLMAEIEPGWTGRGQTNRLLGRIAYRERVFGRLLSNIDPDSVSALAERIATIARQLPGFQEFCRHQRELLQLARDWAQAAIKRYYPYDRRKSAPPSPAPAPSGPNLNEARTVAAQARIRAAMAHLQASDLLPNQITSRKRAIAAYGISPQTLYKFLDLWHPAHCCIAAKNDHTPPPSPPQPERLEAAPGAEVHTLSHNKLVRSAAAPPGQAAKHSDLGGSGGNSLVSAISDQVAQQIAAARAAIARQRYAEQRRRWEQQQRRMESWLSDPILAPEAQAWLAAPANQPDCWPEALPPPPSPPG